MVEFFTPDGPGNLLAELCRLVAQRSPADVHLAADFAARGKEAQKRFDAAQAELAERRQRELAAANAEHEAARRADAEKFDAECGNEEKLYAAARRDAISRFETGQDAAQQQRQETEWEATTIADAALGGAGLELADLLGQLDGRWRELHEIAKCTHELLQQRGQWRAYPEPAVPSVFFEAPPGATLCPCLGVGEGAVSRLSGQRTPRLFTSVWSMLALFAGLWTTFFAAWWLTAMGPRFWAARPEHYVLGGDDAFCLIASGVAAFVVFLLTIVRLRVVSRRQTTRAYLPLRRTFREAGLDRPALLETAKAECQRLCAAVKTRYDGEMKRAEERFVAAMADLTRRRQEESSAGGRPASSPPGGDDRAARKRAGRGRRRLFPPHKRPPAAIRRRSRGRPPPVRRGGRGEPAAAPTAMGRTDRPLDERPGAAAGVDRGDPRPQRAAVSRMGGRRLAALDAADGDPAGDPLRPGRGEPRADRGGPARRPPPGAAAGRLLPASFAPFPAAFALPLEGRRGRPREGRRRDPGDHAPHVDGDAAGQGPLHDPRSGRTRRELLRLHAPGRL